MARKLKTYQTSLGFFDQAISAIDEGGFGRVGADSNFSPSAPPRNSEECGNVAIWRPPKRPNRSMPHSNRPRGRAAALEKRSRAEIARGRSRSTGWTSPLRPGPQISLTPKGERRQGVPCPRGRSALAGRSNRAKNFVRPLETKNGFCNFLVATAGWLPGA